MPRLSPFTPTRRFVKTTNTALDERNYYNLAGLDLYNPDELMKDQNSPYARNFRIFKDSSIESRVAISKRDGHTVYSDTVDEQSNASQTAVTGAADQSFGSINWIAQSFVSTETANLSKLSVRIKNTTSATAPVIVTIHANNSGVPGTLLATSSISQASITGSYAYVESLFVEAPSLTSGTTYWFALHQQSEGLNTYTVSSTTAATGAATSTSSGNSWTAQSYSLNYTMYSAPTGGVISEHAFYRTNAARDTLFVARNRTGVGLYKVNDTNGDLTLLDGSLSTTATDYEWVNADNTCFFVNGVDVPKKYTGMGTEQITNGTFEVNSTGWAATGGGTGAAVARTTTDFHSGVASLNVTATSGLRTAATTVSSVPGKAFIVSLWLKATVGNTITVYVGSKVAANSVSVTSTGSWQQVSTTITATTTSTNFSVDSSTVNFLLDDVSVVPSGVENMGGSPGVAISIRLHKAVLFLLDSANRAIYSNADDLETFDAVSFIYVPAPYTADYVLWMEEFQDNLVFITRNTKWVLYGQDIATFTLRESTSTKGTVGKKSAIKDKSVIYFVSDDYNVYAFNGGTDKAIGTLITRQLENVADLATIRMAVHDNRLRIYYTPSGQSEQQDCLVDDLTYYQWMQDTGIYVSGGIVLNSQSDDDQLIEGSSRVGRLMYGEVGTSDMGKPILFDYWTKYFTFDHPTRKHRLKRLYPIFKAGAGPYYCNVDVDADDQNMPMENQVYLGTEGSLWGTFVWGTDNWGGSVIQPQRLAIPGQNRKHQIRYSQHGVDNPVSVLGHTTYTKIRRPI